MSGPLMESLEVFNAIEQGWMRTLEIADYLGVTRQPREPGCIGRGFSGAADGQWPAALEAVSGGAVG